MGRGQPIDPPFKLQRRPGMLTQEETLALQAALKIAAPYALARLRGQAQLYSSMEITLEEYKGLVAEIEQIEAALRLP